MEKIEELIMKYNEGLADPSEIKLLEKLIEEGAVSLTQLHELHKLDEQIIRMEEPAPSMKLDDQFYASLAAEKRKVKRNVFAVTWPEWSVLMPRLAFASVLLIAGFAGGYLLERPVENTQVKALTREVGDLKEMVMLSLLEKESATDRLRAVSLTSDMNQVSQKVTRALFKTLNEDDNVNVRLAALEVLKSYVRDGRVREELVRSISKQDSPMVQVELAGLMVAMQEKKSVKELRRILENEKTPKEVKSKIEESIRVLI
jgi:hypothetical protein